MPDILIGVLAAGVIIILTYRRKSLLSEQIEPLKVSGRSFWYCAAGYCVASGLAGAFVPVPMEWNRYAWHAILALAIEGAIVVALRAILGNSVFERFRTLGKLGKGDPSSRKGDPQVRDLWPQTDPLDDRGNWRPYRLRLLDYAGLVFLTRDKLR